MRIKVLGIYNPQVYKKLYKKIYETFGIKVQTKAAARYYLPNCFVSDLYYIRLLEIMDKIKISKRQIKKYSGCQESYWEKGKDTLNLHLEYYTRIRKTTSKFKDVKWEFNQKALVFVFDYFNYEKFAIDIYTKNFKYEISDEYKIKTMLSIIYVLDRDNPSTELFSYFFDFLNNNNLLFFDYISRDQKAKKYIEMKKNNF